METTRQYLRKLEKPVLRKLFKMSNLKEDEYWLLIYAFVEERLRANTCDKLHICKTKYATMLNEALIKVDYTINQLDKIRTM